MPGYHPLIAPAPESWGALTGAERRALVAACQREAGVTTPLPDDHTLLHVRVENAIAAGPDTAAARAAARLMAEGLDRHDTIHALDSVLLVESPDQHGAGLGRLTADAWRQRKAG
jgi:hypothetical protein